MRPSIASEALCRESRLKNRRGKRPLIVGAGNAGEMILRDMMKQRFDHFLPVGFLDDDQMKAGRRSTGSRSWAVRVNWKGSFPPGMSKWFSFPSPAKRGTSFCKGRIGGVKSITLFK